MKMVKKARKILSDVHPDFSFKLVKGGELKNLEELLGSLKNMDNVSFSHHVTSDRNDFSNWIKDAIGDEDLSMAIEYCYDKLEVERIIRNRIIELQSTIQKHDDVTSFEDLLPLTGPLSSGSADAYGENERSKKDKEDIDEVADAKKASWMFDFRSLDDIKDNMHTIASGALFGLILGLILGYVLGKF